jgi:hypothetical protein
MRFLRGAVAVAAGAFWTCPLAAQLQLETLGPGSSAAQIVSVGLRPAGLPPGSPARNYGAGIVVGRDGDDILIVTARHVVLRDDDAGEIVVGVGSEEVQVPGWLVAVSDSPTDLAVVGIRHRSWAADGRWMPAAPRMLDVVDQPVVGTRVFALGCPMGACWAPPLEGRIARADSPQIFVRIPYPTEGESGGALVNERGMIVGVFAGLDSVGLQSVWRWSRVLAWLRSVSVPVNIPRRRLEQTGQVWGEIRVSQFSARARRPDGSRAPVPMAIEFGLRIHPRVDLVAGQRNLTLAIPNQPGQLPDGFEGSYLSYGARYTQPLPLSIGRGRPPATIFLEIDALVSSGGRTYTLQAIPDSFDLRTGEQVLHLVTGYSWHGGSGIVTGFRLFPYGNLTVSVSRGIINLRLPPDLDRFRRRSFYELGLGFATFHSIAPLFGY